MRIDLAEYKPSASACLGATLGEKHLAELRSKMLKLEIQPGTLVQLNFEGIKHTNGSYIRATAFWLFLCGQLTVRTEAADFVGTRLTDPQPYDLFIAVANLSPSVEAEFFEFYGARNLPFLVAARMDKKNIKAARLEGGLEPVLLRSLSCLLKMRKASAPEMFARFPNEKITVTGWNNRLSDLHALRLVRRERSGRQWEYQPIIGEMVYGRGIHQCEVRAI